MELVVAAFAHAVRVAICIGDTLHPPEVSKETENSWSLNSQLKQFLARSEVYELRREGMRGNTCVGRCDVLLVSAVGRYVRPSQLGADGWMQIRSDGGSEESGRRLRVGHRIGLVSFFFGKAER
jgi:hypothetical protein